MSRGRHLSRSADGPLAGELTAEYGHLVPAGLIATTVHTASRSAGDELSAAHVARADVAALAAAARRAPGGRRR